MNWQEICDNPKLKDLPFKIELNKQGQILMTPVKVYHSLFQGKIIGLLYANLKNGEALVECAISTRQGTKVADVAWVSNNRLKEIGNEAEYSIAPEICIEIISSTNTQEEMIEKKNL
jgi:Uma2 family endonuclease